MGISREQALDCFRSADLVGIGMEADAVRRRLHPEGVASYVVESRIDCSAIAGTSDRVDAECETLCEQVAKTLDLGGTCVSFANSPPAKIAWFERIFAEVKRRHGSVWLQALSGAELVALTERSGGTVQDAIARFLDAGLDSILPDGADLAAPEPWIQVHRAAHQQGMQTSAAMVFGAGESMEQRVDSLEAVRLLQEETGGFRAFIPLSFQSQNGRGLDEATAVESLKTLAISRMVLDNIVNVQSNWATQGLKVRQMGLRFGGNDLGAASPDGAGGSEEDLRRVIRDAGFVPVQRDMPYRTMFLN